MIRFQPGNIYYFYLPLNIIEEFFLFMALLESLLVLFRRKGYLCDSVSSPHMGPKVSLVWGRFTTWVLTLTRHEGKC